MESPRASLVTFDYLPTPMNAHPHGFARRLGSWIQQNPYTTVGYIVLGICSRSTHKFVLIARNHVFNALVEFIGEF